MPMVSSSDVAQSYPPWSETQKFGVHRVSVGAEIESHFHDCHEYWIIVSGEGDAVSEGEVYHLGPGDMLLTRAGDVHSMIITKDMVAVTYYGVMPEHGRWGHLHEGVDLPWAQHLTALRAPNSH